MTYYVIQIIAEDNKIHYVSKGEYSAFSLSSCEQRAQRFSSINEIEDAMKSPDFTRRNIYTDKSSSPPAIIWSGLGICNTRKKSKGIINILKFESEIVSTRQVEDELIN